MNRVVGTSHQTDVSAAVPEAAANTVVNVKCEAPENSGASSGDGGIRTLVPRRANAFRVRPVMTTSIRLQT